MIDTRLVIDSYIYWYLILYYIIRSSRKRSINQFSLKVVLADVVISKIGKSF